MFSLNDRLKKDKIGFMCKMKVVELKPFAGMHIKGFGLTE
tara:strand:- start:135 stop:254 length:120 start_codon:yes stop_codon:yes gene_type:complete